MTDHDQATKTLIALSNSPLDRTILYSFTTSTGKTWADVTTDEAMTMVTYGGLLREAFPDEEKRAVEVQAIIEEGNKAEGILFGFFDAEDDAAEEWVCDDCRADEEETQLDEDDLTEPRSGTGDAR